MIVLYINGSKKPFSADTPENLLKDTEGYFAKQMAAENQTGGTA